MIRNLLATTAIATLMATGATAQTTGEQPVQNEQNQQQQSQQQQIRAEGHLASNLMGEAVYNGAGDEAENIGDVTDLVINDDGSVKAIVVGVGGFLGIGQKEVALEYDVVQWQEQQDGERRIVVDTTADALEAQPEFDRTAFRPMPADADVAETTPATQEDLASAPQGQDQQQADEQADVSPLEGDQSSDTAAMSQDEQPSDDTAAATDAQQDAQTDQDVAASQDTDVQDTEQTAQTDDGQATQETGDMTAGQDTAAEDEQTAQTGTQATGEDQDVAADQGTDAQNTEQTAQTGDQGTDQMQTGAVDRSTLQEAQPDQIRAENLTGTTVYGANEESVGEIGDVILTPEGDVDAAIVDVGGFLGIGQKEVALSIDNLAFMTDENGDLYLYTEFTQEQLEAQPEYDQATYAQQRDQMLLQSE